MNLRSVQQEDTPPGNSGSFSPFDAYEVSCRARAEEVALHLSGDSPRIWVPRSCHAGLGDLAGGIIERFMEKSRGDSKSQQPTPLYMDGDEQGKNILPGSRKASPPSYRKVTGPRSIQFLSDAFLAIRQKLLVL